MCAHAARVCLMRVRACLECIRAPSFPMCSRTQKSAADDNYALCCFFIKHFLSRCSLAVEDMAPYANKSVTDEGGKRKRIRSVFILRVARIRLSAFCCCVLVFEGRGGERCGRLGDRRGCR